MIIPIINFRFVDENGNSYAPKRRIQTPYGAANIFTGPKVFIHTS